MAKKTQFNVQVFEDVVADFCDWEGPLTGDKGEKAGAALLAIQGLFQVDQTIVYDLMQENATVVEAKQIISERVVRAVAQQEYGSPEQATQEAEALLKAVKHKSKERSGGRKKR